jgi:hypothetical protein
MSRTGSGPWLIRDRAAQRLAELIHDADLEDDKFHRIEGFGVERVFKGWAKKAFSVAGTIRESCHPCWPPPLALW